MQSHSEEPAAAHGVLLHPAYLARLERVLPAFDRLSYEDQDVIMLILSTWLAQDTRHDYSTRPLCFDTVPLEEDEVHILGRKAAGE